MSAAGVKIVQRDTLLAQVSQARRRGRKVVLCHGCFDIVHPGHIRHLEFAHRHGDILVVSITGDAAIDKDVDRPYIPEELRAENLAALEVVDWVFIDPHHTAAEILSALQPDVYVKGEEYRNSEDPRFIEEQRIVESNGGKVVFSSGDIVFSSTELIRRIGRDSDIEDRRLQCVCQRHDITRSTLHGIVERFRRRRVAVIGDAVLDRYVYCDALDVANESPMMSLKQLESHTYPGGAAVVARHLARLGAEVVLLSSYGSEPSSDRVLQALSEDGVMTVQLLRRDNLVVKTRYLVERAKLLKVEESERVSLDSRSEPRAAQLILDQAAQCDAVVFCDYGYGCITDGLLERVLGPLRDMVGIIAADVSGTRRSLQSFQDVDLFCPTERELRATLHNYDEGLSRVAWQLMSSTQARHLIATLGRRGLVAFDRPSHDPNAPGWEGRLRSEYLKALNPHATDPMGCGDALLAGCTLALSSGANFIQAVYLGNMMAAQAAAEMGNVPVDGRLLRAMIDTRAELVAQPHADRAAGSPPPIASPFSDIVHRS
jgi:rfaE bifunctional protein kinase chain/domain/rfaE bifunctional protein nucleotidyltransferase chain/domain